MVAELVIERIERTRWTNRLVVTGESPDANEFLDFFGFLGAQEKGMVVTGEPCKDIAYCPCRDPNCLDSKVSHCIVHKKIDRAYKIIDNYRERIKGLNGKTPDNVLYYLDLAKERIIQGRLSNAGIYLKIVKRKLEED